MNKVKDEGIKAYPGVALTAVALVVVILFGIMGSFLLYISSSGGLSAAGFLNGHKAYYIAHSGVEYALNELAATDTIVNETVSFGDGQFTITNTALTDTTFRLRSVGSIGKYTRNIQMDYYYINITPNPFEGAEMSWDLTQWDEGTSDISGDFDGTEVPVVADTAGESIIEAGNDNPFTISAWVKLDPVWDDPDTRMVIASLYQDADKTYALFLEGGTVSGEVVAKVALRYRDVEFVANNSDVNDGEWHLVTGAAVRNGNTISCMIYVDDTQYADLTQREPGNPVTGDVVYVSIGSWSPEGGDYFSGSISSVGVYQEMLTEEDVSELYYANPDVSGSAGSLITQILSVSEF
jgi:hypothetical protein